MSQEKKYTAKEAALAVLKTCHDLLVKSEEAEQKHGGKIAEHEKDQTPPDGVEKNNPDAEPKNGNPPTLGEKVNAVVEEHLAQHGHKEEGEPGHEVHEEDIKGHIKLAKFIGRMEQKREGKKSEGAAEGEKAEPLQKNALTERQKWRGTKRLHGAREHNNEKTGPTGYKNRNKSSDMDHGQKKGPQGYGKYQEQAQNQKGIHTPVSGVTAFPGGKGTSRAGDYTKDKYGGKPTFSGKDHPAIKEHKKVLSEMKSQPKPNLPKSEKIAGDLSKGQDNGKK